MTVTEIVAKRIATDGGAAPVPPSAPDIGARAKRHARPLRVGPFLDPIKALVQSGTGELVKQVIVAGKTVVKDRKVVSAREDELVAGVRRSTDAAWGKFSQYHHSPEPIDVAYPPAFKAWSGA